MNVVKWQVPGCGAGAVLGCAWLCVAVRGCAGVPRVCRMCAVGVLCRRCAAPSALQESLCRGCAEEVLPQVCRGSAAGVPLVHCAWDAGVLQACRGCATRTQAPLIHPGVRPETHDHAKPCVFCAQSTPKLALLLQSFPLLLLCFRND